MFPDDPKYIDWSKEASDKREREQESWLKRTGFDNWNDYLKQHNKWKKTKKYLKIRKLNDGFLYKIFARNAYLGIWIKDNKSFVISRHKWGRNYLFEEYHWDTGEPFGSVKPFYKIGKCPFDLDEIFKPLRREDGGKAFNFHLNKNSEKKLLDYLNKMKEKILIKNKDIF
tara:strand:- start:1294 stop:1803 length:510 start_codon:yes stop_codon:yes gene_type:complete